MAGNPIPFAFIRFSAPGTRFQYDVFDNEDQKTIGVLTRVIKDNVLLGWAVYDNPLGADRELLGKGKTPNSAAFNAKENLKEGN